MRNFTTKILAVASAICLGNGLAAQDIHFSQYNASPLNLNPALTGVIGCDQRITANYRNQWASVLRQRAFTTSSVSYDVRLPVGRYDYFGVGGTLWTDKVGSSNFSTFQGTASGSYVKRLSGLRANESYLGIGAQLGITQRSVSTNALIFGSQWDGSTSNTNPNAPTDPRLTDGTFDPNLLFADMGAGLIYYAALNRQGTSNFYAGLAFHHLNGANISFNSRDFKSLYTKFTFHAGGEFMFNDRVGLVPAILYMKQGPSFQINGGTSLKFRLGQGGRNSPKQAFYIGSQIRIAGNYQNNLTSDAAIFLTKIDVNNFSIGLSYDMNISALKPATNGNGAFEVALQYKICKNRKRRGFCPEF